MAQKDWHPTSDHLPGNDPRKEATVSPNTWAPDTQMGDMNGVMQSWAPDFGLEHPWLFGQKNQQIEK